MALMRRMSATNQVFYCACWPGVRRAGPPKARARR